MHFPILGRQVAQQTEGSNVADCQAMAGNRMDNSGDGRVSDAVLTHGVLPIPNRMIDWLIDPAEIEIQKNSVGDVIETNVFALVFECGYSKSRMLLLKVVDDRKQVGVGASNPHSLIVDVQTDVTISIDASELEVHVVTFGATPIAFRAPPLQHLLVAH